MTQAPATTAPPQTSSGRPPRRYRRIIFSLLASLILLLAIALAALWWWIGSDRSLAFVLAQAGQYLPAGQSLQSRDVSGSLRRGGRIGWLRWQSDTLAVEVHDARIGWQLGPLLRRQLQFSQIHLAQLQIERRGPGDDTPTVPLQELTLPFEVDLPWRIDRLRWVGPPAFEASALAGRYHYQHADTQHRFVLDEVAIADGRYSARATLQGAAPMALEAQIDGHAEVPVSQGEAVELLARVSAAGTLAGADARLRIDANVHPGAQPAKDALAMQAQAQATLAPWAPQPVVEAHATLENISPANFWPQAPAMRLSGALDLSPDNATGPSSWQGRVALRNDVPGAWDAGRLPIARLEGAFGYDGDSWTIRRARIDAGGGRIEAQGRWSPSQSSQSSQPWQVQATVEQVQPGALHGRFAGAPISGKASARQDGEAIVFDTELEARTGGSRAQPPGLQLRRLVAQGRWQDQVLTLARLQVQTEHARLEGKASYDTAKQAGSGELAFNAPGAALKLAGSMAPADGRGILDAHISDAAALHQWLRILPVVSDALADSAMQGSTRLNARWQGGWQTIRDRIASSAAPAARGAEPTLQATLDVPRFELQRKGAPSTALQTVHAELSGSLTRATLVLRGDASFDTRRLHIDTRASGGLAGADQWQVAIEQLHAQLLPPLQPQLTGGSTAAPWSIELPHGLSAKIRAASAVLDVQAGAGSAILSGPAPGTVRIDWDPLRLIRRGDALRLQSHGKLRGLPVGWVNAFGQADAMRGLGVSGDLIFDGDWNIDMGDTLHAQAQLVRRSGDIRVQAGEAALVRRLRSTGTGTASEITTDAQLNGTNTPAGLRQAQLRLTAEGESLRATLAWDSERAGTVQAEASTRLAHNADGWRWPEDAPLAARVQAHLPRLGVWSMLAPPGWRVSGTLEVDATLGGSRAAPRWNGRIAADQFALRAAVEGIDLRNGRLRATLSGNRLTLDEFALYGGSGNTMRIAGRSGNLSTAASEAAQDGGALTVRGQAGWDPGTQAVHMALQGELSRLRVLAHTDRQLTLSGNLQAGLDQGQIRVRGQLRADRAAIILPDETASSLGKDVVVRSAAKDREAAAAAERVTARTRKPLDVELKFDFGRDFAVQGRGVTTRLEGQLQARSTGDVPRLTGEVRTVEGRYRAYGQQLDIENGMARFNGPFDNPALDILALRPNIPQRAGVQITGSAQHPRLKLYSEPSLPDAETLSWIMLGRASATSGAETMLVQQAALALLNKLGSGGGDSLASQFGLDEIGFRSSGTNGDFTDSAVSVGKRLAHDFYVTYERSLAGTVGTLFIFYDLTSRLTLRGQAGEHNGVDLIYTVKYD